MKRPTTIQADGTDFWMNSHGVLTEAADSVLCSRLATAARSAHPGGDSIDHGLSLLAELRRQGFGVIYLSEPGNAGVATVAPSMVGVGTDKIDQPTATLGASHLYGVAAAGDQTFSRQTPMGESKQ